MANFRISYKPLFKMLNDVINTFPLVRSSKAAISNPTTKRN